MAQRKSATQSRRKGRPALSSRKGINSRTSRASIGFPSERNRSEAYENKRRRLARN